MEITMDKKEYAGMLKYLLHLPFEKVDCDCLRHAYFWKETGVLENLPQLRNRVAMNDLRAYLDEKNPSETSVENRRK